MNLRARVNKLLEKVRSEMVRLGTADILLVIAHRGSPSGFMRRADLLEGMTDPVALQLLGEPAPAGQIHVCVLLVPNRDGNLVNRRVTLPYPREAAN